MEMEVIQAGEVMFAIPNQEHTGFSNRASVHTKEVLWRCDFCDGATNRIGVFTLQQTAFGGAKKSYGYSEHSFSLPCMHIFFQMVISGR